MYVGRATQVLRRFIKIAETATDLHVVAHKDG